MFYSLQFSPSFPYATTPTSLITDAWNKGNPQLCMVLEVTFFLHLIYACLCGSVALILQYKDNATQRDRMKRQFEVIWKDVIKSIELQALNLNAFCSSCCGKWRRGHGESKSRYSTVTSQHGQGQDYVLLSVCRLTLYYKYHLLRGFMKLMSLGGDGNCMSWPRSSS